MSHFLPEIVCLVFLGCGVWGFARLVRAGDVDPVAVLDIHFGLIKGLVFRHFLLHDLLHNSAIECLARLLLNCMQLLWVI